jgi:Cu-Zn family superoxide dismutase
MDISQRSFRWRETAFLGLVVTLFVAAPGASAQEARTESIADTATISAIDPEARELTVGSGADERRFRVDENTKVEDGGERVPLSSLEVGDRIAVSGSHEGPDTEGLVTARDIVVVRDEKPAVSAGAEASATSATGQTHAAAMATDPASPNEKAADASGPAERTVSLHDPEGKGVGDARFVDSPNGLLIHVSFFNLPPGELGFHVHEKGLCEPDFDAAGAHLEGGNRRHGLMREDGPHAGDLVNLHVGSDGRVQAVVRAPALRLAEIEDRDGAALVIHANPDDYESQPTGNAGDRIACGVIAAAERATPSPTP